MSKEKDESFLRNYLIDTAAGTVSGAGAAVLTHPLDTETIRAQNEGSGKGKGNTSKKTGIKGRKINFDHFKTPYGRKKIQAIARDRYSGLGPRLKKTTVAGAIGYPLFTASQSIIEDLAAGQEKNAGWWNAARVAAKSAPNFLKGMSGMGKMNLKSKAWWGGTGTTATAFAAAPTATKSTLEKSVKGIPNLELAGTKKVTSGSRYSKLQT